MDLAPLEAYQRYAALGPDFLTWLLARVLDGESPKPASEPDLDIDIQGPLLFVGEGGEARQVTLAGEEAASAPEVFSALREGKRLSRAKLLFTVHEDAWRFTLDATTFDVKSVKLPVPSIPDTAEFVRLRSESLMRLHQLIDELFEAFLPLRLEPQTWRDEVNSWRRRTPPKP